MKNTNNQFKLNTIGGRIAAIRAKEKLTQEKFSEMIGMTPNRVSRIENGHRYPNLWEVAEIAKKFRVSTDYIIFGNLCCQSSQIQ